MGLPASAPSRGSEHPGKGISGISAKQVFLNLLINNYKGPEIILDFNKDREIIGMEFIFD